MLQCTSRRKERNQTDLILKIENQIKQYILTTDQFGRAVSIRASSALKESSSIQTKQVTIHYTTTIMSSISIPKNTIYLAALIYKPTFTSLNPAIIVVHLGGGLKEQTANLYAQNHAFKALTPFAMIYHFKAPAVAPHFLKDPTNE